jgi:RNA 2',3'-cyclic 3'-phosphodiesterase
MVSSSDTRDGVRSEPTRRLFFALWPDESMQAALAAATRTVVAASDGVAVPAQNFHFTLAFLGAVGESRIPELGQIAAGVAATSPQAAGGGSDRDGWRRARADPRDSGKRGSSISITLDRIEHWKQSQILCATATRETASAGALAEALARALTASGFAPDLKPFRAHATLARKVRRVSREREMPPVHWTFRDFRLVESRTDPRGAVYSSREIWPLYAATH